MHGSLEPYRVDWSTPDGRWIAGAPLTETSVKVHAREKCAAMARWGLVSEGCDLSFLQGWPETLPPFLPVTLPGKRRSLLAAPNGHLVILRTPAVNSPEPRYDVVDRQGRLAGTITLDANEMVIGFGPKSIYVLVTDEWDLQTLQRHPWP